MAVEECNHRNAYGMLFSAFLKGQFNLLVDPPQELLMLNNPYDISERQANQTDYYFDYAMYDGHYYVYFGPAPVLLIYYPYYWLTGRIPSEPFCLLALALLSTPLIYLAVLGMVRRYGKRPNLFLLSLSCLTASFVAGWPTLATGGTRFAIAIGCGVVMMAGALGFGYHALTQKRGAKRTALFVLCGVCFALQGMSRANTLLMTTAMLAPGFVGVLTERSIPARLKARDAACFLLPALAGVGLVMWYNFARFGSVVEFGQSYQLTADDIRYNTLRLEYAPQALWQNLLEISRIESSFPYVTPVYSATNVTGNYFWRHYNVGVLSYPLLWLLAGLPACLRAYRTDAVALRRERGFVCCGILAMSCVLMIIDYCCGGLLQRYTYDYLLGLALLSVLVGASISSGMENRADSLRSSVGSLYTLLCGLSIVLCLLLAFSTDSLDIRSSSPEFYFRLARMFYPY